MSPSPRSAPAKPAGLRKQLARSRALILDILHYARRVPGVPVQRHCNIERVARLRRATTPRMSWPVLFMKAFSLVAERHPALRQTFMPYPWPHLYEHPTSTARMTVTRYHEDQDWVFFAQFVEPESTPLPMLQQQMEQFKRDPVESIPKFRLQAMFSRWPTLLRRIGWATVLYLSGQKRVRRLGTFGLTTVSARGAMTLHPPSIFTSMISFGPVDPAGNVSVVCVYDHRVLDGYDVAGFLAELESELNGAIADELQELATAPPREYAAT